MTENSMNEILSLVSSDNYIQALYFAQIHKFPFLILHILKKQERYYLKSLNFFIFVYRI